MMDWAIAATSMSFIRWNTQKEANVLAVIHLFSRKTVYSIRSRTMAIP